MNNSSLQKRIAVQRARLADAKRRMKGRANPVGADGSPTLLKSTPMSPGAIHEMPVSSDAAMEHIDSPTPRKAISYTTRRPPNLFASLSSSHPIETPSGSTSKQQNLRGMPKKNLPHYMLETESSIAHHQDPMFSSDEDQPSTSSVGRVEAVHRGLLKWNARETDGDSGKEGKDDEVPPVRSDSSSDLDGDDVIPNNSNSIVPIEYDDPTAVTFRGSARGENSGQLMRLKEALKSRQMELSSAKEEVLYTGNLVNMLKENVESSESHKKECEAKVRDAEKARLTAEAEVFALRQELDSKAGVLRMVQTDYEQLVKDHDALLSESRRFKISEERSKLELELSASKRNAKVDALENALDENRALHQKTQARLSEVLSDLKSAATVRIELNNKVGLLENELETTKAVLVSTTNASNKAHKEALDEKTKREILAESLATANKKLEDSDTEALTQVRQAAEARDEMEQKLVTAQRELVESFEKQTELAKEMARLESELNAKPKVDMVPLEELNAMEDEHHAVRAELDSATQLLLAKDSLISKLRDELNDAEATTRSRRQDFARRDSIAARQAGTLSAQLQSAESRLEAMKDTVAAKDVEVAALKSRLEGAEQTLQAGRNQRSSYLKQYEDVLAQKQILQEKLSHTKEELEAKLYIVQQLNERLTQLEQELTSREADQRERHVAAVRRSSKLEADLLTREAQNANLKQKYEATEADNIKLRGALEELRAAVSDQKQLFMDHEKEAGKVEVEMRRYKAINIELQKQIDALKKSREDSAIFNQSNVTELETVRSELERARENIASLQLTVDEKKRLSERRGSEASAMRANITSLQKKLQDADFEKRGMEVSIKELGYELESMRSDVSRYKSVRDEAHDQMSVLRSSSEATASLVESLQMQLSEARSEVAKLRTEARASTVLNAPLLSPAEPKDLPEPPKRPPPLEPSPSPVDKSTAEPEDTVGVDVDPDLVVTVEIGDGVARDIEVFDGDDIEELARNFVLSNGLGQDAVTALVSYIQQQMEDENAKESEEAYTTEDTESVPSIAPTTPPPPPPPFSPGNSSFPPSSRGMPPAPTVTLPPPPLPPALSTDSLGDIANVNLAIAGKKVPSAGVDGIRDAALKGKMARQRRAKRLSQIIARKGVVGGPIGKD